ncbi:PAS domain S-box protein [Archangium violaceum]|uniref:PAS domain S-box protein n=1 Tax=Archangium violaceum TaxID=83451 RepID=UPI001951B92B|nr:PAS domain S-box protein [Archangium violaceum]QRN95027.1 PAS domain S-box protein [Archangium violaceum]
MTASSFTLLLVDDSPEDRGSWAAFLRQEQEHSYSFLESEDAEGGLALCLAHHVDCVVLDYGLPGMDGLGFLRRLKEVLGEAAPPVVLVTGRGSERLAVSAMKAGASDYLIKSDITPASLYRATHNAIEKAVFERRHREAERECSALLTREKAARAEVEALVRERERLLREAEAQRALFDAVLQQMPSGVLVAEPSGKLVLASARVEQILRFPFRASQGVSEYGASIRGIHPDGRPYRCEEWPLARSLLSGEVVEGEEMEVVRQDGSRATLSISSSPVRDALGQRVAGVATFMDVTARKRAEAEFDNFFRLSHDLLAVAGTDGFFKRVNPAFTRTLGWSEEQLLFHPFVSLLHPDDLAATSAEVEKLSRGGHTLHFENRYRCKDGSYRWLAWTSAPVPEEGLIFAVARDVTETKRLEAERDQVAAALRESEGRYRALALQYERQARTFDALMTAHPDFMYQFDRQHRFTYVNRSLLALWGKRLEEAVGKNFQELGYPPELVEKHRRQLDEVLRTGRPVRGENPYTSASGTGHYEYIFAPIFGPDGQVEAIAGTSRDITERKLSEEELRRRAEFEQQLVGIVSHDLRNPITAILLGAQSLLARRNGLDEKQKMAATRIQSSAERAARMVRDLLDFTQARLGGGIPIQPSPLDLHSLTRQVLDEVRMSYPERNFRLDSEGDGQGQWDPDRLAQVITNLVSNAAKYSPAGTLVTVVTRGQGDQITLMVHNTGDPIPSELRPRLFQPMTRGTAEVERASRSIGLGLYIVNSIVQAHGGSVDVSSSADEGTTFTVRLPRHVPVRPGAPASGAR